MSSHESQAFVYVLEDFGGVLQEEGLIPGYMPPLKITLFKVQPPAVLITFPNKDPEHL